MMRTKEDILGEICAEHNPIDLDRMYKLALLELLVDLRTNIKGLETAIQQQTNEISYIAKKLDEICDNGIKTYPQR